MKRCIPYVKPRCGPGSPEAEPACGALNEAEATSVWAGFFDASPPPVPQELLDALKPGQQMDPGKALMQENINDILKPGYLDVETGYCTLPGGGAYASVLHRMPELTCDVFEWFMRWWGGKDIGYKLWCPGYHYKSAYGWVNEDVGNGPEDIYFIKDLAPEDFRFDPNVYHASDTILTCSSNAISKRTLAGPEEEPLPSVVAHFIRPAGKGMELRSRFWLGFQCSPELGLHRVISPERNIGWEAAYNFMAHCMHEYSFLKRVAPKVYQAVQVENKFNF